MHTSSSNFTVWTQTAPSTPASSTDPTGIAGAAGTGPGAGGVAPPMGTAAAFLGGSGGTSGGGGGTSGGTARKAPMKPICVGELIAHTDAVNTLLPLSPFALCAGGSDGLVSLWKVRPVQVAEIGKTIIVTKGSRVPVLAAGCRMGYWRRSGGTRSPRCSWPVGCRTVRRTRGWTRFQVIDPCTVCRNDRCCTAKQTQ